jgi:hypothetical protein
VENHAPRKSYAALSCGQHKAATAANILFFVYGTIIPRSPFTKKLLLLL